MCSNQLVVMSTHSHFITHVKLVIGVQIITLWIAASVAPLVTFSHSHLHSSAAINQAYQPPNTIGSPKSSLASGTR